MVTDGLGRRDFLKSLGTGTLATMFSSAPVTANQPATSNSDNLTFGAPIERIFNNTTKEDTTSLGSINDDSLFVSYQSFNQGGTTSKSTVAKVNRFRGNVDWSKTIDDYVYGPTESAGRLYFAGLYSVFCWDATTGDELWRQSLNEDILSVDHVSDQVFIKALDYREKEVKYGENINEFTNSTLYVFDAKTGAINWSYSSESALWGSTIIENNVVLRENQSYVTDSGLNSENGHLISFNKSNGNTVWKSDSINPQTFVEQNGVLASRGYNGDIYLFDASGEQILHYSKDTFNYYITNDILLVARSEGGVEIFDHSGKQQIKEPLYSEVNIPNIRSGLGANAFLLVTDDDELIGIDDSTYKEQFRITQPANSLSIQHEIAFATHDTNQITAINIKTGKTVWQGDVAEAESLRTKVDDSVLYVSGDAAPLRAYSGRRGRAFATLNRMNTQDSLSGTISNLAPGSNYLSQARAALQQSKYSKAHRLLNKEERRRLAIDGILGASGLAATYGTGRVGASKWRHQQLATAVDRVDSSYPIEAGELAGLEPTDIIAQGYTARDYLDSKTSVSIRQLLSNDYSSLLSTLTQLADRHHHLVSASKSLAAINESLRPKSWTGDLQTAVEQGNFQRIDTLLDTIQTAENLLEELQSFSEVVTESSFSVSTDQFRLLLEQELSESGTAIEGIELIPILVVLQSSIETIQNHQNRLSIFAFAQKRTRIKDALQSPTNLTVSMVQEFREYPDLFEAAEQVEKELSQVDFSAFDVSQAEFENRAQAMFERSNIDGLASLTETLQQMRVGRWAHSDLFSVTPTEFEHLIAALFANMGYQVAVTEQQNDKGIDVIARSANEVLAIQVKQYSRGNNIGRTTVQQIVGAMAQSGADQAIIVSSADFTKTAVEASRELGNAITLVNGKGLVQLLTESPLHPQSNASEYRSQAHSNSSSESQSQSNQRTSHPTDGNKSMSEEVAYEILNVDSSTSQSEIKSQYREKVKSTHPDTGGSAEEFKKVKQAFTVLSGKK